MAQPPTNTKTHRPSRLPSFRFISRFHAIEPGIGRRRKHQPRAAPKTESRAGQVDQGGTSPKDDIRQATRWDFIATFPVVTIICSVELGPAPTLGCPVFST